MSNSVQIINQSKKQNREWFWLVLIVVITLLIFLCLLLQNNEPSYNGRKLSAWLRDLRTGRCDLVGANSILDSNAVAAVREVGSSAIPYLVGQIKDGLSAEDQFFKLQDLRIRLPFQMLEPMLSKRIARCDDAVCGLIALGDKAQSVLPELDAILATRSSDSRGLLLAAAATGSPALAIFSNCFLRPKLKCDAVHAAGSLGRSGVPLVPLLISVVKDANEDDQTRADAALSLGRIGEPAEKIVPVLRDCLATTNGPISRDAAFGLMFMANSASEALPALESMFEKKPSWAGLLALVVFCQDDARIAQTLGKSRRTARAGGAEPISDVQLDDSARTNFASVRVGWTNCNWEDRRAMLAALSKLLPSENSNP